MDTIEFKQTTVSNETSGIHVLFCNKKHLKEEKIFQKFNLPSEVNVKILSEPIVAEISEKNSGYFKVGNAENVLVVVSLLKNELGRHTGSIRADLIPDLIAKNVPKARHVVIKVCCERENVIALTSAISRAFPMYSKKSKKEDGRRISVEFVLTDEEAIDYRKLQRLSEAVRKCANLVDMPTSELNTDTYVDYVNQVVQKLKNVKSTIIRGQELKVKGFGGLWGVGKAASNLPALVILEYSPVSNADCKCFCMVGKGIVYDTGGLSIKDKGSMPTMKCDMGGSAAILCAFELAALTEYRHKLCAVLCLAENSVDASSTRPDDILYMYSGKTVEVNNTDAEGRLVLADGVAYASKHLNPDVILDMATLTGAQLICTGEKHAAILTGDAELERLAYESGQTSGDWVYPILYSPELLKKEFNSEVADMKNSVKNRANAQSSCAGHFIEDHVDASYKGKWIHVDIAGPAFSNGRATGFGVAFLDSLSVKLFE